MAEAALPSPTLLRVASARPSAELWAPLPVHERRGWQVPASPFYERLAGLRVGPRPPRQPCRTMSAVGYQTRRHLLSLSISGYDPDRTSPNGQWCNAKGSFSLDICRLDDGPPFLNLGLLEGGKRFRRRLLFAREAVPKRWIVERTIAWLNRCGRLAKDWENLNRKALAFLRLASIRLMLRKLCNPA
jgi:Transposase DDE domain